MSSTLRFSSVSIDVSVQTVWEYYMDRIMHPDRYLKGVKEFKILRQTSREIVRYMKTAVGEIIERITIDSNKSEITYNILQHPVLKGRLVSQISPIPYNKNGSLLTIINERESKNPASTLNDELLNPKQEALSAKMKLEAWFLERIS